MPGRLRRLTHGAFTSAALIPGEDAAELNKLALQFKKHFMPAPGPEEAIVDELTHVAWRLRRLQRAEQVISGLAMSRYLQGLPPKEQPRPTPSEPMLGLYLGLPEMDKLDLGYRILQLEREADTAVHDEWYDDVLLELKCIVDNHGVEAAAKYLKAYRRDRDKDRLPDELSNGSHPDPFDAVPLDSKKPNEVIASFRKAVDAARKAQRQRARKAREEAQALRADVAAVFAAGAGAALDPRAPSVDRLTNERRILLKSVERLLRTLAQARALGVQDVTRVPVLVMADPTLPMPKKNGYGHESSGHQ